MKTEEQLLKEYYADRFKLTNMPEFCNLTNKQIEMIRNTMGFAGFRLSYAIGQCSKETLKIIRRALPIKIKYK